MRKAGRPHHSERIFTAAQLERLREQWLQGRSHRKLAMLFGCSIGTIRHHLEHSVIPQEHIAAKHRREEIIAKVDHLYAVAWDRFEQSQEPVTMNEVRKTVEAEGADGQIVTEIERITRRTGEATWLSVIQWCLDWYSRVGGYYAAQQIEQKTEFRVAGKTPSEVDREMLARLREQVEARRRFAAEVGQGKN